MLDHRFRVTKYDPRLRDARGVFTGDDWTSISDVGGVFDGRRLTWERYEQVEAAHVRAVQLFAQESGVTELTVRTPSLHGLGSGSPLPDHVSAVSGGLSPEDFHDGLTVSLTTGLELVRAMLREDGLWCLLEAEDRFRVAVGWDYYLYIGSHRPCSQVVDRVRELGLFVDEGFISPYDPDLGDPMAFRPADEEFWTEVESLAARAGGELPLLEMWAGNAWRWHLVTPGEGIARVRSALRPRAVVTVFTDAPVAADGDGMTEIEERIRRLLHEGSPVVGVMCLIEDRETGKLHHAYLLDEDELPAWLETARSARRCGVYPVETDDRPEVLTAVLPDEDGTVRARWS
ncbi:RNA-binding protein [Planomonospora corallina]|uniref:RNA-binding protein n=1 Tax=Planomonospora corallina TaxID=1806052 RepID=A0ABV8IFC5_9ACTN